MDQARKSYLKTTCVAVCGTAALGLLAVVSHRVLQGPAGAAVTALLLIGALVAAGVVLADGRVVRGTAVAANVNTKLLYTAMIPESALDPAFLRRMRAWRCGSGTFRMNVALSELPSFTALPGHALGDHHTAGIILAPSLAYMDRAYSDARALGWSREPIIEMAIPSTLDLSLIHISEPTRPY